MRSCLDGRRIFLGKRKLMMVMNRVRKFEDLPENAQNYVKYVEKVLGVPINFVGVGAGRDAVITH